MKAQYWILALTLLALALVLNKTAPAQSPTNPNGRWQVIASTTADKTTWLWDTQSGTTYTLCSDPNNNFVWCFVPATGFSAVHSSDNPGALPIRGPEASKQSILPGN